MESKAKARKPAALQIPTDDHLLERLYSPMADPSGNSSIQSPAHVHTRPSPPTTQQNALPFSHLRKVAGSSPSKACLCSPTTHAGSFRCRLHRSSQTQRAAGKKLPASPAGASQGTVEAQ